MSLTESFTAPASCLVSGGNMLMPGLPSGWVVVAVIAILALTLWAFFLPVAERTASHGIDPTRWPLVGTSIAWLGHTPWILVGLRLLTVWLFLVIVAAGLFGTPMPRQNAATLLTWNLWWSGVIVSVFFLGSAWCAICPWDALATWLVQRRLWRRAPPGNSLDLPVPKMLRGVWVATLAFVFLSWLELGYGLTVDPYATAMLALLMVLMATLSLAIFQKKAFCRHFCPVGRTIGAYSQLAPVSLRPRQRAVCEECETLECYHGTEQIPPCPTSLVMGRLKQNTYCLSCGHCTLACPHDNVSWRLRPPSREAMLDARPHWDEAWFMLVLLTITLFHGFTMLDVWENMVRQTAVWLGDSGRLIASFTLCMALVCLLPPAFFALMVKLSHGLFQRGTGYSDLFSGLAFLTLPLAFGYHLAHNLMHLNTETHGIGQLLSNPLSREIAPLSGKTIQDWMDHPLFDPFVLHFSQMSLMLFGYWLAMLVWRHRARHLFSDNRVQGWPLLVFSLGISGVELWMLSQPMLMRFQ
ncbi:4Fe-4S binding protein [Thiolapillus sp.]